MPPKIILLSGKGKFSQFVYNGLQDRYPIDKVIIEEDIDYDTLLKRRRKKIGRIRVIGQRLFNKYIVKKLMEESKSRVKEIIQQYRLNPAKIPRDKIIPIRSVNDNSTIELLQELAPDIVLVNGTRIIGKKLLKAIDVPFVNMHSGINPDYRGNGGAYWALVSGEPHKCGSTIHMVDEGVDTGTVLYQDTIEVSKQDNYLTYHFIQLAKEIELVKKALDDIASNNVKPLTVTGHSRLWYEPTIWAYWYNRIVKRVK